MVYELIESIHYLNVRFGPGSTYPIVGRLARGTGSISSTGETLKNGDTTWMRISAGKLSGWVNSDYLKPAGGKGASQPRSSPNSDGGTQGSAQPSNSPTPVPTPAPSVTPSPSPSPTATPDVRRAPMIYEVVNIPNGDYLNVRSGAESTFPIVGRLAPGTGDISSTGEIFKNGDTAWMRISAGKLSGWVNSDYLKPAAAGKDVLPPQPDQESTDQIQPSATPQGSEAEQRARYWAAQGYHFNPKYMTADSMDRKVVDIDRAKYWESRGYHFNPDYMTADSMDRKVVDIDRARYWESRGYHFNPEYITADSMGRKVVDIDRAKYWESRGYHFNPEYMTADSMDRKVVDIDRAKYWESRGYHFNPEYMTADSMDQEVERMKRSQQ
jgi:uncharacterized protein YraI